MSKNIYEEFLRLVGFEEDEMSEYVPEWREAAEKLRLTEEDIRYATEERIPTYFEVDKLVGVRKALGAMVREIIDLTKANEYKERGVKIVYGILPAIIHYYYALKLTAPDKVFVSFPDILLVHGLNMLFHKLNPLLEEAERGGIPYGCRHCALNKTRYAANRLGLIPPPDISWTWGFICDEGPKTDEFIRMCGYPEWKSYVTRMPHDQLWGVVEYEDDERVEYLAKQMKDGFEFTQNQIGIKVPPEKIQEVIGIWTRYAKKLAELLKLMATDPQPLSGQVGAFFCDVLFFPFNTGIGYMEKAIDIMLEEIKQRVASKEGMLPVGAPKLMAYFIPVALPWVAKLFEDNGVGLTYIEALMPSKQMLQPPKYKDPYMIAAETWLKRSTAVNLGLKATMTCEKVETYDVDGMVFGFLDFDRWLGSDNRLLAKMVADETKRPVYYIEGDLWEDRDYSYEALRTRIESICSIVKMRKTAG